MSWKACPLRGEACVWQERWGLVATGSISKGLIASAWRGADKSDSFVLQQLLYGFCSVCIRTSTSCIVGIREAMSLR